MEIRYNPEYQNLVPSLEPEEYKELKKSIERYGLHSPIVVNTDGLILDGHHRYRICSELGIEPRIVVKKFESAEEEAIYILETNVRRRQLSTVERIRIVHERLEPLERELARKRQVASLKSGSKMPLSLSGSDEPDGKGRTVEKMAKSAGTSPSTYKRTVAVLESASPEVKEKMIAGEIAPAEAHREMKGEKKPKKEHQVKGFIVVPSSLFDQVTTAIKEARAQGADIIRLRHDGHTLLEIAHEESVSG